MPGAGIQIMNEIFEPFSSFITNQLEEKQNEVED